MKFIIATNNKKKLHELQGILDEFGIEAISLSEAGISSDVEETGTTFEENAILKASAAMRIMQIPAIADDSGLVVDALNGDPGIYSARYGGEACQNDTERYELLLKNLEGVPEDKRSARFVSAIACVFPDGRKIVTRGECEGRIALKPQGEGGFGYDPVFLLPDAGVTMAQIPQEKKNQISHRAASLAKLREELKKQI